MSYSSIFLQFLQGITTFNGISWLIPSFSKFLTYCDVYNYSISFYKTKMGEQQKTFFIFWNSCCCPLIEYFDEYEDFDELTENIFQQCIKFAEGKLSLTPCKFVKQNNITKRVETSEWFEPKLPFDTI